MLTLGIDCGLLGGMVALEDDTIIDMLVMPTIKLTASRREYHVSNIVDFFEKYSNKSCIAYIERQQSMPRQGVSSTFKTGYGFGLLIAMLYSFRIRHKVIQPREWQKKVFSDLSGRQRTAPKPSIFIAESLYPKHSFRETPRCRIAHTGLTDALCIARYGQLVEGK